jgi:arylformamidase
MSQITTEYESGVQRARKAGAASRSKWIDITVPISNELVHWPGDPPVSLERVNDMEKGDSNNVSKISMGSHTGTHADAPRHFIKAGQKIGAMPLEQMIGAARVIQIRHAKYITPEELAEHNIRAGERILFKTRNSAHAWYKEKFDENFISISSEAADYLAQKAPKMVGIDYLSVGGFKDDGAYIHRTLLGSGIWLIEGLDLSKVRPGRYYLNCLPLKLESGDGAPVHAILRPVY